MIKKSILQILVVGLFLVSSTFCSSADKTADNPPADNPPVENPPAKKDPTTPSKKEGTTGADVAGSTREFISSEPLLDEFNEKLKDLRYPDGETIEGFEYKKWEIPNRKDFIAWIKNSGNIFKEALDKLPESIKLEITGHADNVGPEQKEGNRLGNIYYSTKRAEEVKKYVVKVLASDATAAKKIESRMVTRGAGSSELIPGIDGSSSKNRRVTFKFISTGSDTKESESGDPTKESSDPTKESDKPTSELDSEGK